MRDVNRWRGFTALIGDAIEHGSLAVERLQKQTAQRPFTVLEAVPVIAPFARVIHTIHDANVSSVHIAIRAVNRAVENLVDGVLQATDETSRPRESSSPP